MDVMLGVGDTEEVGVVEGVEEIEVVLGEMEGDEVIEHVGEIDGVAVIEGVADGLGVIDCVGVIEGV